MGDKLHEYRGAALDVTYDASRCIHFAACVRTLPQAFDPGSRPWVMPDNGTAEAVVRAVELCPTGALHYVRKDGGAGEQPAPVTTATVSRNGPVYLRGDLTVLAADGSTRRETRMALCRCGASTHKPYCDGSHTKARFLDPGKVAPGAVPQGGGDPEGPVQVRPEEGGPVVLTGILRLADAGGAVVGAVKDPALCRCGRSGNKPFCDGSHARGDLGG